MATYTTSYGHLYKFSFERQADWSIRAYIVAMASYGNRDTSLHATHRQLDGSRYYVCWNKPLRNESDARTVAAEWSKRTDRYIRAGTPFTS